MMTTEEMVDFALTSSAPTLDLLTKIMKASQMPDSGVDPGVYRQTFYHGARFALAGLMMLHPDAARKTLEELASGLLPTMGITAEDRAKTQAASSPSPRVGGN